MEYVITAFAILILAAFFGFSRGHAEGGKASPGGKAVVLTETDTLKQSEIRDRLKELAKTPPPEKLSPGAMCYDMALPVVKNEYTCPECGEKTLYTAEKGPRTSQSAYFVRADIPKCRRIIEQIKALDIELDETEFCGKCSPDLKTEPKLSLVVRYSDRKEEHRVAGVSSEDLAILQEFLSGKDRHKGLQGEETAMKDHLERLEELLGVSIEELERTRQEAR